MISAVRIDAVTYQHDCVEKFGALRLCEPALQDRRERDETPSKARNSPDQTQTGQNLT